MKCRNYEKQELVILIIIIVFLLELVFFTIIFLKKEYSYKKMTGIVLKEEVVIIVVSKAERKIIYKNHFLYLNDKKLEYEILEDRGAIITKGNTKYYEILLGFKFPKKYKVNDILELSIKEKKHKVIEMFKIIWEGE